MPGYTDLDPTTKIITSDLNNDGREDLVVTYVPGNLLFVMLNTPGGNNFTQIQQFTIGDRPVDIWADDIGGDGWKDLLIANLSSGDISVLLARGYGFFNEPYSVVVGGEPTQLLTTDLDGDGIPDLVVTLGLANNLDIRFGKGDGTFEVGKPYVLDGRPECLITHDFNSDGFDDIMVAKRVEYCHSPFQQCGRYSGQSPNCGKI